MKILALDASTESCSVALYNEGEIVQRFHHQPQQQAKLLLPECDALLAEAGLTLSQVDAVAFCNGPGSFTGLRVATAAAHGIAFAHDLPLITLSTLLTLAYGEYRRTQHADIVSCIDARMNEVYYGVYHFNAEHYDVVSQDTVLPPADIILPSQDKPYAFVGNGWSVYKDQYTFDTEQGTTIHWPEAQDLALLALREYKNNNLLSPAEALPVYIRDNVAAKKKTTV